MKVQSNGIELEVERTGKGKPLVLVMGIGATLVHWSQGFYEALEHQGFEVFRFDNRDCGLSTWMRDAFVPDPRKALARAALGLPVQAPYQLKDMADDLAGLLDAFGIERAHVCGASMGGMIVQEFSLRHPSRVASMVSIMSTPGERKYVFGVKPAAIAALLGPPPKTSEQAEERVVQTFSVIGSPGYLRDEVALREIGRRGFARGVNPAGFARQMGAILSSPPRSEALRSLQAPSLVIHGTADPLIPVSAGRATARAIPGARMMEFAGMGHDLPRALWPAFADAIAQNAARAS